MDRRHRKEEDRVAEMLSAGERILLDGGVYGKARCARRSDIESFIIDAALRCGEFLRLGPGEIQTIDPGSIGLFSTPRGLPIPMNFETAGTLVLGASGSGKTESVIQPAAFSAIERGMTAVYLAAKGRKHSLLLQAQAKKAGAKFVLLAPCDPAVGLGFDALEGSATTAGARRLAESIVNSPDARQQEDNWVQRWLYALVTRMVELIATKFPPHKRTLGYLHYVGSTRQRFRSFCEEADDQGLSEFHTSLVSDNKNHETVWESFRREVLGKLESCLGFLSNPEFKPSSIGAEEQQVIVVELNPAETQAAEIGAMVVEQILSAALIQASKSTTGRLPRRILFAIDEAGLALLPSLPAAVNFGRESGLGFLLGAQSLVQFERVYGNRAASLVAGFRSIIGLGDLDLPTSRYISERAGVCTVAVPSVHLDDDSNVISRSFTLQARPLLIHTDLARPPHPQLGRHGTFLLPNLPPFQAYLTPIGKDPVWSDLVRQAPSQCVQLREKPLAVVQYQKQALGDDATIDEVREFAGYGAAEADTRAWFDSLAFDQQRLIAKAVHRKGNAATLDLFRTAQQRVDRSTHYHVDIVLAYFEFICEKQRIIKNSKALNAL